MPPGQGTVTWLVAPRGVRSSRYLETALGQDLTSSLSSAPAPGARPGLLRKHCRFPHLEPVPGYQTCEPISQWFENHCSALTAECDRDLMAGLG